MKYDDLHDEETRITDKYTGGQKGSKLTRMGALDPIALIYLARVAGYGAEKYEAFNYLKGYPWSLTQDAGQRHNLLFWAGEDIDVESGLPHPALEAWHALAKLSFYLRGIGTDDRPPAIEEPVTIGLWDKAEPYPELCICHDGMERRPVGPRHLKAYGPYGRVE